MVLINWVNNGIKNLKFYDISLIKLTTAAFVLAIAKIWPPLLSLDLWVYILIGVLAVIIPMKKFF